MSAKVAPAQKPMPQRWTKLVSFPREDNVFRSKGSLDFDMMRSKIMLDRQGYAHEEIMVWVTYTIVGFFTGVLAFMLTFCEDKLTEWRSQTVQKLIDKNNDSLVASYFFFMGIGVLFVTIASVMTVKWGPGAMGSGVAEVMGLLNGINYPNAISFTTLTTKVFGILFAVCGGLCIGKEGPLVHIGANIGAMCCHLPFKWSKYLQNDKHKRDLIAAGGAAGVSVAFGAPIGGALFAYEISRPNTFWNFGMLWKVFLSTSIACFTLAIL